MSSIGQAVGGVVGATIGFFATGGNPMGAVYGAQIGMGVGGLIDPPKGPNLQGPRLSDLSVQTSTYGANISRVHGAVSIIGNVFWLEGDSLKETAKKTKQGGKGGPSSTTTNYSYSATFAVGLCRGPIVGVLRVWIGSKLIYDAGSTDIETVAASNQVEDTFRVYLGDDTQLPDPRMQADKGAANVSAHRGLAYIVFYDLPLAEHGNSLMGAQVKVEVMEASDTSGPYIAEELYPLSETGVTYSIRRNPTADGELAFRSTRNDPFGVAYKVRRLDRYSAQRPPTSHASHSGYNTHVFAVGDFSYIAFNDFGNKSGFYLDGTLYSIGTPISSTNVKAVVNADEVLILIVAASTANLVVVDRPSGGVVVSQSIPYDASLHMVSDDALGLLYVLSPSAVRVFTQRGEFVRVDTASTSGRQSWVDNGVLWRYSSIGSAQDVYGYEVGTWTPVYSSALPGIGGSSEPVMFVRNNIMFRLSSVGLSPGDTRLALIPLYGPVGPLGKSLSSVVAGEVALSEYVQPSDIDVTALTQQVRGYRVSSTGSIRAAIEPLQAAWPFDAVQAGYKIKFKPRGGASVATIPAELLDARSGGDSPGTQLVVSREMDSQLPRKVTVKHLDVEREYDTGAQVAERINTDAVNVLDLDLAIVLNAQEAAQKAEVLLYMYWLERSDASFRLPPAYLHLEPSDVITITSPSATYELRLVDISYLPDGRLECRAKFNRAAIYTPTALGAASAVTGRTVKLDGPSLYQLLDVPAMTAVLDTPSMLAAMTGYTTGWPGGILFRSSDGGQTWSDVQAWSQKCTMGTARDTLATKPPDVIDASLTMQVDMISGTLESVTQLSMLNGANHFAYGVDGRWEIIAAQTCTLQGDGSYILRDFLRGRFGTEQHAGSHAAGDYLIHLNDSDVAWVGMDSASIGLARKYRGITSGRAIDTDTDLSFTYAAVNLKPLSPVYLNGSRHPTTNDWTLTWVRRTRVSGEWRDFIDAPLSEATEAYEVEIYSSGAYTTLKRTLTSTSTTVSYTSANQVTDFGSNQSTLFVKIYQMSATVGRGFPLTASITR